MPVSGCVVPCTVRYCSTFYGEEFCEWRCEQHILCYGACICVQLAFFPGRWNSCSSQSAADYFEIGK
eukprot:1798677-Prorocentrum_lima.AAC.1